LREGPQFHPMVRTLLLSAGPSPEPRLLTFSDQKILGRIPCYSLALRCYSVMHEIDRSITVTPVVNESKTPPKLSDSEKAHRICSGVKVVCTVAVAVLAAGRTGPAAPGSERADRLHLLHVRCTALPAQCSHAEWCGARFATPPTCAPVSGVNTDDTRLPWSNSAYMCALQ
jgi:hypothetical protein